MYSMSVLCPLCAQTSFSSIDALRCSLIKAANGPLACPICHELFLGLDKLTIHLFSHTNIMNSANNADTTIATAATPTTTTPTPTPHNPNTTNIEKLKINKHCENLNNINNNNSKCHEDTNEIIQINVNNNEGNFVNTRTHQQQQQQLWEKNMITKASPPDKTTIVNKLNSTQQHLSQHQQVSMAVSAEPVESRELKNVAQCDICEFTFRNEELRNMHIRLVHQNSTDNVSNKTLTTTTALAANNCQNPSNLDHDFKCHLCAKTFKTKGSLRVHLKVVHLMGLPYANNAQKITICDRIRHNDNKMLNSANPSNNDNENLNSNSIANSPSTSVTKNNCSLFNITPVNFLSHSNVSVLNVNQPLEFPSDNLNDNSSALQASANVLLVLNTNGTTEMASDTSSISNNLKKTPSKTANDSNVPQHLIYNMANVTENPKIWECDVCSKAFTTKYFLKKHKRLHTGEMPYTCELCARTFTFQQSYHKHLLYHSDEKPHVCATCGRAFKELSTLHNHERIHSGEKPFKCEVCGKSFRQRVSFLVHTRIHTGVMPYKCELCQRSFRYKVSQRTHKCQTSPTNDETGIDNVSENFIKAFLETSAANEPDQQHLNQSQHSPASNEIAAINEKAALLNEQQALLAKTIDDIVVESCNKMGIGSDSFATEQIKNEGSMSPSQKLQNMRLYSPQMITPDLSGIEGDLTRFFLENSTSGNNLF